MSSSNSPLKPIFGLDLELLHNGFWLMHYDRGRNKHKTCWLKKDDDDLKIKLSEGVSLWRAQLRFPTFDSADVAAGLPEFEAIIDALHHRNGVIAVRKSCYTTLDVNVTVEGDNKIYATNLFAKKIATLVMLLEKSLLVKLVAPYSWPRKVGLVSEMSKAAQGPWPQGDLFSSEYASHVPMMAAMEPATGNDRDLELMHRKLAMIWSAHSLRELECVLRQGCLNCAFYLRDIDNGGPWKLISGTFKYMQVTFDPALLRNWVEVIARITELALAGPDEYKRCLEAIFRIQYKTNKDGVLWEQLMKHILGLEHRIPDWRDQLARYEQGEVIAGVDPNGLLPKRMGPFYSQPPRGYFYDSDFLT
ncbi:uncharacterized protein NECHADRAFT_75940 [Fusarium vanettenii 77-13-4]|uniref:Uncharacterized protein n=1 Tax=Fusarium vanettenii (strain ATCC MYA-4622 / CBS 123669 / FGSC 9596 / NRRL 45880 / 77-13-4) TaxID=660122 RepID=C7Z612_FUSV7|nr:uncharacterized protein NECHADRAFT_75940 [Fusarium vanettenii 77-13-4]EEU40046.1 hypothetical protein NECHADRAFT_75940 [Fusarium vanettenii 77-13-4]